MAVILTATFGLNAQIQNYSVGATVNDFTVTDIDGNSHTLSDYTSAGKWVVLDFFFVDCPPCQATVQYFNELHEKYGCNEGDLVYDCFMGSGTTAKMSIVNKRNWIGSEMSEEYCDIIKQRLNAQQKELF